MTSIYSCNFRFTLITLTVQFPYVNCFNKLPISRASDQATWITFVSVFLSVIFYEFCLLFSLSHVLFITRFNFLCSKLKLLAFVLLFGLFLGFSLCFSFHCASFFFFIFIFCYFTFCMLCCWLFWFRFLRTTF